MSCTTLAVYLVSLFAALALAGDIVHLDSLTDQCNFMVDGNSFNLCPLFQEKKGFFAGRTKNTPPTVTSNYYSMSLGGPLAHDDSKPADHQVCQMSHYRWAVTDASIVSAWDMDMHDMCVFVLFRSRLLPMGIPAWNRLHNNQDRNEARLINVIPVAGAMSTDDNPFIKDGEYTPGVNIAARMAPSWLGGSKGAGERDLPLVPPRPLASFYRSDCDGRCTIRPLQRRLLRG